MRRPRRQHFDTPYERDCVATTDSDRDGNFEGIDSEGAECTFNTIMVIDVRNEEV
jgi:hypothetical protein